MKIEAGGEIKRETKINIIKRGKDASTLPSISGSVILSIGSGKVNVYQEFVGKREKCH